jgi:hypothetical protein
MMKHFSKILLFMAVVLLSLKSSAQGCDQNLVLFDCYNAPGATLVIRNSEGFIVHQNILNTVNNNIGTSYESFLFELSLADGCYTIQLSNDGDNYFIVNMAGTDHINGDQYYSSGFSNAPPPEYPFSCGGVAGCTNPSAVNYLPGACYSEPCYFGAGLYNVVFEICELPNGIAGDILYDVVRGDCGGGVSYGGTIDGGHQINRMVLGSGLYEIRFLNPAAIVNFTYVLTINGSQVATGSSLDPISFSVGTGVTPTGCTDSDACNYVPEAICDDGSCLYNIECCANNFKSLNAVFVDDTNPNEYATFNFYNGTSDAYIVLSEQGDLYKDFCLDDGCYTLEVSGAIDVQWSVSNVNGLAYEGVSYGTFLNVCVDGNIGIEGCTDPGACNYDSTAVIDNGSCYIGNNFTLTLGDFASDGWEGSEYFIRDGSGNIVKQGTLEPGIYSTDLSLCLPDGCYDLEITGGNDDAEVFWILCNINNQSTACSSGGAPYYSYSFFLGPQIPATTFAVEMTEDGPGEFENASWILYRNESFFMGSGSGGSYGLWPYCSLPDGCYRMDFNTGTSAGPFTWSLIHTNEGTITGSTTESVYFTLGTVSTGCTDPAAVNFDPLANCNDESCTYDGVPGCTNLEACNYNSLATVDNGSCVFAQIYYADQDGDGFGNSQVTNSLCSPQPGFVNNASDCNDSNAAIHPGATEICNGTDDDCDGLMDEGFDVDGDGYTSCNGDCNDNNAAINPGATENLCNGTDDNCNGTVDEGRINGCTNATACNYNALATCDNGSCTFAIAWYLNADGDNYYASTQSVCSSPGAGWTNVAPSGGAGDCNDSNAAINPSAPENLCNGIDDNCNGTIDEGRVNGCTNATACNYNALATCDNGSCTFAISWYLNADGDNYYTSTQSACSSPGAGWTIVAPSGGAGDCNDNNAAINPAAIENLCNGIDDNCNGTVDEGRVNGCTNSTACNYNAAANCDNGSCTFAITWYLNSDGDNYYTSTQSACSSPGSGWTSLIPSGGAGDCNDNNSAINPGATENRCNGIDDNCNGTIDEGRVNGCTNSTACNYNPAATCDNGSCTFGITWYLNADGDNYYSTSQIACSSPGTGWTSTIPSGGNGDCNDNNATRYPGATELCGNGADDDCDGLTDEGCGGGTSPVNNEPSGAILLTVNSANFCTTTTGNLTNATASVDAKSTVITGQDLWYKFTAMSSGVRIRVNSGAVNILIELQDASGNIVDVENANSAVGKEILNFGNLIVGQEYRICVRNYNSAQGTGTFTICVSRLNSTQCTNPESSGSLCGYLTANYVSASAYKFILTSTNTGLTYTKTVNGISIVYLSSIPGLLAGDTYTVAVDAVYNLLNGVGGSETITVIHSTTCLYTILPNSPLVLRPSDVCPNIKQLYSTLKCGPSVCNAIDYQWEFTRISPSPAAPIVHLRGSSNQALSLLTVPGLTNGTYNVRIRPILSNGTTGQYGSVQCVQIGSAPAGMVLNENESDNSIQFTEELAVSIFPNPASNNITIENESGEISRIDIVNALGQQVYSQRYQNSTRISVDVAELPQGIYLVTVTNSENKIVVTRLIKE